MFRRMIPNTFAKTLTFIGYRESSHVTSSLLELTLNYSKIRVWYINFQVINKQGQTHMNNYVHHQHQHLIMVTSEITTVTTIFITTITVVMITILIFPISLLISATYVLRPARMFGAWRGQVQYECLSVHVLLVLNPILQVVWVCLKTNPKVLFFS